MKALASQLTKPRTDGFIRYCAAVALVALAGSLIASWLVESFLPHLASAESSSSGWLEHPHSYWRLPFASALEALAVGSIAEAISRRYSSPIVASLIVAVCFATLSSALLDASFFLPAAWVYFIAAGSYFAWRARSEWRAGTAIALTFLLVNSVGFWLDPMQGRA